MNTWQKQLADAQSHLRQAIQDAAIHLIEERGMPDVSMAAVAREAGVSRQTLYNHYPDIETIVLDAARSQIETAGRMIGDATSSTPDAPSALEIYIRGTLAAPTDRQVAVTGGGMSSEAEEAVLEMLEPIHLNLRHILQRGVEEGTFRTDLEPQEVSEVIFHMIGAGRRLIQMGRDVDHVTGVIAGLIHRAVAV